VAVVKGKAKTPARPARKTVQTARRALGKKPTTKKR
jgi:hypothetical protein